MLEALKEQKALETLKKAAVISATHDAGHEFQRPGCHEGTRVAVLERLMHWLVGNFEPEAVFLWLYGDAGAGKSSIGQSFAVKCAQERRLLASFFFWRNEPQRSSHIILVATLIYQVVTIVPALRTLVAAVIDRDPFILGKHLRVQIISLLVEPINELISTPDFDPSSIPTLILVDGLDECSTKINQVSILMSFAQALPQCRHPLKILIASRPEVEIMATFNCSSLICLSTRIALSASFDSDDDIEKFLVDTFDTIRSGHPISAYIPASWPKRGVIRKLVERTSGQFIFASTIGKYISDPDQKPVEQLDIIMALRPAPINANMPYTELNALYTYVLSCVPTNKIETALDILTFIMVVRPILGTLFPSERSLPTVRSHHRALLFLLSLEPGDPSFYLANLSSVLKIHGGGYHPNIQISHASLRDFLLDPRRSQRFYCNPQRIFTRMLGICLECLTTDGLFRIKIIQATWLTSFLILSAPCKLAVSYDSGESLCRLWVLVWLLERVELTPKLQSQLMKISLPKLWDSHRQPCGNREDYHFLSHALALLVLVEQKV